uniref:E3 ubiquitin protein ligase n=1 Tax=Octactis speculum TaxID=3111310 RepID=A0A7S2G113_9STRA|mmetsp:Transcript_3574/g.4089  ORF Transcript_3574/g.4089 Transcript_3574/m.4089 type:complete len:835 (+) Transcript_3574:129-2633(+)|eukprot:CAMPEP_0185772360 /NCGR_PEP_ID=MMETSP1174-20130828/68525_1 /TAXON_ID=35687 /ORGANISM="Dictyocha speculum, Strain CCMP1381" /LENGTH=834 /DNA_ID=CAMNT_0028458583 /DNA_START=99 /DNA_END=2600 /DNA_ORIENTATION=+
MHSNKRPLEALPGGSNDAPPLARGRFSTPTEDDSNDDTSMTALDVALLQEKNRQLVAALSNYQRRMKRKGGEISKLRRISSDAACASETVLRQWEVLNADLLAIHSKFVPQGTLPLAETTDTLRLRRDLAHGPDSHLLVRVAPSAVHFDVETDDVMAELKMDIDTVASKAVPEDDSVDDELDEKDEEERATRLGWVQPALRSKCRLSEQLLVSLLESLSKLMKEPKANDSEASPEALNDREEDADGKVSTEIIRERALRAQIELLRSKLEVAVGEAAVERAAAAAARVERHRAERELDLFRADKQSDNQQAPSNTTTTKRTSDSHESLAQAVKYNGSIDEDSEEGSLHERAAEAFALADSRRDQLEKARNEIKRLEEALTESALKNAQADTDTQIEERLNKALEDCEREKSTASAEREKATKVDEAAHKRIIDLELKTNEMIEKAGERWKEQAKELQQKFFNLEAEAETMKLTVTRVGDVEKDNTALRWQLEESTKLCDETRQRLESAKEEAERARTAEGHAQEALKRLEKLSEMAARPASGQENPEVLRMKQLRDDTYRELKDQRAMNDALLAEVESLSQGHDTLSAQNSRLLKQGLERENVNKTLMTRSLKLMELKQARIKADDALLQRAQAAEALQLAYEEQLKAQEPLFRAAATQKHDFAYKNSTRDRDLATTMATLAQRQKDLAESKGNCDKQSVALLAMQQRVTQLTDSSAALAKEKDDYQEQLGETKRRQDKVLKRLEKAKDKIRAKEAYAQEDEGKDLLEFEISELRKQVNCPIIKEMHKSVVLIRCGHTFSKEAVDQRIADRMRRCPACNKPFGLDDVKPIYLTW